MEKEMKGYTKDEKRWMMAMGIALIIAAAAFIHILTGFINLFTTL